VIFAAVSIYSCIVISKKKWKKAIDDDMKVRGLKRPASVDRMLWRIGCKIRPTPTCGYNKSGFTQMMTGAK